MEKKVSQTDPEKLSGMSDDSGGDSDKCRVPPRHFRYP